ncbi:ribonuclease [Thraustotheca clavata]|uniref:ribonuclease H n=1 Tax=Thraustotheca clavata TaxID=74557 RepID=A0A1W0A5D0_9STRA|nr:ribonuclease [Thraustotheca clavata]
MAKEAFYAVAIGRSTGIFKSWDNGAKESVTGFCNARYKKFPTEAEAAAFIKLHGKQQDNSVKLHGKRARKDDGAVERPAVRAKTTNFYAVAKGRNGVSGIFTSWAEAEIHVKDFFSAKYKGFYTREEAESFIAEYVSSKQVDSSLPNPQDPNTLVAFCDGSAINNGKHRCKAAFACVFPHNEDWNVASKLPTDAKATNNRAEYMAALEAMKRANIEDPSQNQVLYIFSDSMLLIRSMTEWLPTWIKNNWVKGDGERVKNDDLLKQLKAVQGTRMILWQHVKAHTKKEDWESIWNAKADRLAKAARRND